MGICSGDKCFFLFSTPFFDFRFSCNGVGDIFKQFEIYEVVAKVFSRKCYGISPIAPMLDQSCPDIVRNPGIQSRSTRISYNVNVGRLFSSVHLKYNLGVKLLW